jgi:hypothetical protein
MRAGVAREIRQFRQLVRLSHGRLLDAALASRDIDADYFVIWGGALLATPLMFYAIRCTSVYAFVWDRQPQLLPSLVLADRLFFVIWAMMAALLLVSLSWDALLPDRTDQQILGVLPVRSRTVAAARVSTALVCISALIGAISVPGAAIYALGGAVDNSIGFPPAVFATQVVVSTLAGLFTASVLVTLRVALVVVVGSTIATRIALLAQLVTVIALIEAFLFLPGVLPAVLRPLLRVAGGPESWLPAAWFLALYAMVTGPHADVLAPLGQMALAAVPLSIAVALAAYVLPARINARRALEAPPPKPGIAAATVVSWLATVLLRAPVSRAVFAFTLISVARNKRHLLIVASYCGIGAAIASLRLISSAASGRALPTDVPADYSLALPLVLIFFVVGGLRGAFAVPTDLAANWVFRLEADRSARGCLPAVRAVLIVVGVLPVGVLVAFLGSWWWGVAPAMLTAVMCAASGVVLVELALVDCHAIPFTRARGVLSCSIKVRAPLGLLGLHVFAFRLDDFQLWALATPGGPLIYLAAMAALVVAAIWLRHRRTQPDVLAFDAPVEGEVLALNLSSRSV